MSLKAASEISPFPKMGMQLLEGRKSKNENFVKLDLPGEKKKGDGGWVLLVEKVDKERL